MADLAAAYVSMLLLLCMYHSVGIVTSDVVQQEVGRRLQGGSKNLVKGTPGPHYAPVLHVLGGFHGFVHLSIC